MRQEIAHCTGHFVSQVQDFTHLKYETSKESTRDCEKVGHSETEDETGKLAVAKSVVIELLDLVFFVRCLHLVLLKRMTGKAERLAIRARARSTERTATFWLL